MGIGAAEQPPAPQAAGRRRQAGRLLGGRITPGGLFVQLAADGAQACFTPGLGLGGRCGTRCLRSLQLLRSLGCLGCLGGLRRFGCLRCLRRCGARQLLGGSGLARCCLPGSSLAFGVDAGGFQPSGLGSLCLLARCLLARSFLPRRLLARGGQSVCVSTGSIGALGFQAGSGLSGRLIAHGGQARSFQARGLDLQRLLTCLGLPQGVLRCRRLPLSSLPCRCSLPLCGALIVCSLPLGGLFCALLCLLCGLFCCLFCCQQRRLLCGLLGRRFPGGSIAGQGCAFQRLAAAFGLRDRLRLCNRLRLRDRLRLRNRPGLRLCFAGARLARQVQPLGLGLRCFSAGRRLRSRQPLVRRTRLGVGIGDQTLLGRCVLRRCRGRC